MFDTEWICYTDAARKIKFQKSDLPEALAVSLLKSERKVENFVIINFFMEITFYRNIL